MKARRLNNRVEIIKSQKKKNSEGKAVQVDVVVNTIFCEVIKSTIKEFKETSDVSQDLNVRRNTLNLIVRYQQKVEIESDMKLRFKGHIYKINNIEPNHQDQDYTMIGADFYE